MARKKFSCDFETTTDLNDCRVWAYGWMEIGNKTNYKIGNSLDEFMEWVEKTKSDLFFHNLKFDGSFIINWLLKRGYTYSKESKPKTFNSIISRMGQWYMIDICYGYKGKRKLHTVIYDSLKKLPFPVRVIAKAFNLPIMKGDIDYHSYRPIGHEITEKEYAYIKNDIEIVADALEIQFNEGLDRMTNGSDSLYGFKEIISKKRFERLFPVFNKKLDDDFRKYYRGGFTWVNDLFQNRLIGDGIVFDVNSLYPSQMRYRELPYGTPQKFDGKYEYDEKYPLYLQALVCTFELKPGHIPTIQIKKNMRFKDTEYLKSSDGELVQLYVTNIDLELIQEHYILEDVEYVDGWKFKSKVGLFNEFIDYWMHIKETTTGAKRQLAKLMLNSLYGKFASNPKVTGKIPELKDDGANAFKLPKDEEGNVIEEYKDPIYTPMGVFITSWARYTTITTAQKCFDRIIYCDTDSIHLAGTEIPEAIKDIVDPNKLGYWKHEGTFKRAKFIRQKTYVEQYEWKSPYRYEGKRVYFELSKGKEFSKREMLVNYKGKTVHLWCPKLDVKCAGMTESIKKKVNLNNFKIGFSSYGKLLPKQVSGGVVLVDTEFTIK